jgi:adenylate cyclase
MADLAGITQRARELSPEQFRALVAEYHRTLGRVLSETGGKGIVSFADTVVAVYRSARQAVLAAAKLQLTASGHAWRSDRPIWLAVALDSGEVVATGHGHFGPAVVRCGRLLAKTRGGQILLSEATRNLLEGDALGQLEMRSPLLGTSSIQLEVGLLRPGGGWRASIPVYELLVP